MVLISPHKFVRKQFLQLLEGFDAGSMEHLHHQRIGLLVVVDLLTVPALVDGSALNLVLVEYEHYFATDDAAGQQPPAPLIVFVDGDDVSQGCLEFLFDVVIVRLNIEQNKLSRRGLLILAGIVK